LTDAANRILITASNRLIRGDALVGARAISAWLPFALVGFWPVTILAQDVTTYSYDALGRLTQVSATASNGTVASTYSYDRAGNRTQVSVSTAPITLSPTSLPTGTVGSAYSQTLTASGGTGGYSFSLSAGSLPTGLTLSSAGVLSGTPSASGTSSFTVKATDGSGNTGTRAYSVTVNNAGPTIINLTSSANGANLRTIANSYGYTGSSTANYQFVVGSSVTITGYPGNYSGVDTGNWPAGVTLALQVNGTVQGGGGNGGNGGGWSGGANNSPTTGGAGGDAIVCNAPIAITVNSGGTVQAGGGGGGGGGYVTHPGGGPIVTEGGGGGGGGAPNGTGGTGGGGNNGGGTGGTGGAGTTSGAGAGGTSSTAKGGDGGYYANAGSNGVGGMSGPGMGGAAGYAIRTIVACTTSGSGTITGTVGNLTPITLSPVSLPNGTVAVGYSQTIAASGGTGAGYSYSVSAGALPAGLTLSSSGALSGTPSASGTSSFTLGATDSGGNSGTRAYSLTVNGAVTLSPTSLPNGTVGSGYSQSITASGGTGAGYSYSVSAGALPAGLTLSSAGALSGTPSASGTSSFTLGATDSGGNSGTRAYSLTVNGAVSLSPASLPNGVVGSGYSQTITASGGTGSGYSYSVIAGALPSGLTLSSGGALSGTPSASGTSSFTLRATDAGGNSGSRAYSLTVNGAVTLSPTSLPSGSVGSGYSQTITASGGTGSGYSYSVSAGTLPAGLSLSSAGALSGTPSASGTSSFTLRAVDGGGNAGTRAYSLTINSGGPIPINLSNSSSGVSLRAIADSNGYTGSPSANYQFIVGSSVTITGFPGGYSGIDTGSWPAGVTLSLQVNGTVRGSGGTGGNGGGWNSSTGNYAPTAGGSGGHAIVCSAPIAITVNSGGTVQAGGGGGGGGGYVSYAGPPGGGIAAGSGGGGGAPNGAGGNGGSGKNGGANGVAGASGTTSGGGAGGTVGGGQGGNGGNYANAGSMGGGPSGGGAPGAAGYAVRKVVGCTTSGSGTITGTVG